GEALGVAPGIVDGEITTFDEACLGESLAEPVDHVLGPRRRGVPEEPDHRHRRLLRARRERPCSRAAERDQQFPPSDGDCHTPLPREVRRGNDSTPLACSLHVQGGRMLVASTSLSRRLQLQYSPPWRTPPSRPRAGSFDLENFVLPKNPKVLLHR